MILNSRLQPALSEDPHALPVLLIHGLFGSLDNLGGIGRQLNKQHTVLQVDVRNHGLSPHADQMDYATMAQDMLDTLDVHHLDKVLVIGHSMGGKIAMTLSAMAPERIRQLVVIDIAPVVYQSRRHDAFFKAMRAVADAGVTVRHEAAIIMRHYLDDELVIQFLLKSFLQGEWRFNLEALYQNYDHISGWQHIAPWPNPALFIRGARSAYLDRCYQPEVAEQFPHSKGHVIANAGHWVHAEKPVAVIQAIQQFFANTAPLPHETLFKG